jgi:hypothetical protein
MISASSIGRWIEYSFPRRGKVARSAGRGMPGKHAVFAEQTPRLIEHPPSALRAPYPLRGEAFGRGNRHDQRQRTAPAG